jgi:histidine ammonia-lyase
MANLDGEHLTIEEVVAVAAGDKPVSLALEAVAKMLRSRAVVERLAAGDQPVYGVNTGVGLLADVRIPPGELEQLQRNVVRSHACGVGEPLGRAEVRAMMLIRANVLAKGFSGIRPVVAERLCALLNCGITPVVPSRGSVGASGDLAPMSQIALSLMGEGEAFLGGERMPTRDALVRAGLAPPGLQARDGLAAINGSNLITGIACLLLHDAERWIAQAEVAASMTLEALMANMRPYEARLHELRGFRGAQTSAANLRRVMEGSDLWTGRLKVKVQDAYSMRSTPQVIGALRDQMAHARRQLEIELNAVADNPIFVEAEDRVYTGANFQGTPVSLPLDTVGAGVTMVSVLSERRLNRLLNPALSVGLPAFLTKGAGMFSGLMLSQYTADTLIVEQRILSTPSYIQSIPAAADQEDFVSMGMNAALKTRQILDNARAVLAIEMIAAAQALDFRSFAPGRGTRAAHAAVRGVVEHLDEDRPLYRDHNAMTEAVGRCVVLEAVEIEVGSLATSW